MSTQRQQQIAMERRSKAGLPVLICPNCGVPEPHWIPDSLASPGRFVCSGVKRENLSRA